MAINREKKFLIVIIVLMVIYIVITDIIESNHLKKYGIAVNATVYRIMPTRGSYEIDVTFEYNHKSYNSDFGTNHIDSLKRGTIVKMLISTKDPDKYHKYLYVVK